MRELLLLTQILNQDTAKSDDLLAYLLKKGLRSESLRELLATACIKRGRTVDALTLLRTLIREGTDNPQVYEEAARLLFANMAPVITPAIRLGPEADEGRDWCAQALALEPGLQRANEILAWTMALAEPLDPTTDVTIRNCLARTDSLLPATIEAALAVSCWRDDDAPQARQHCTALLASKCTPLPVREIINGLLTRLDQTPPPPPPPAG